MFFFPSGDYIKSPLNYIGGKYKLLPQIIPLFPKKINTFVDLFVGGANIAINVQAKRIICNDNLTYLISLYNEFKNNDISFVFNYIEDRISEYELSDKNEIGFKALRDEYNMTKAPLDLFVLLAFSFNHQIRFNSRHEFNTPFGKERSSFNPKMQKNLRDFLNKLAISNIYFECNNFDKFDLSDLSENDFVYCDPPYLITSGTYNDGKRGFTGWDEVQEKRLLCVLDSLGRSNVKFALSNVIEHKGISNEVLKDWLSERRYNVHYLTSNYRNSNYHSQNLDKGVSIEVLVTNY